MKIAPLCPLPPRQSDMVAAGVRHGPVSLSHLVGALERVNAVSDCVLLARLNEAARPGVCVLCVCCVRVCGCVLVCV